MTVKVKAKARIEIDGAEGEGGGQVLRSALSLAMVTGTAVRIAGIRAKRDRPGLMRQHLAAVRAAQAVCGARVAGAEPGSSTLTFDPGPPAGGDFRFAVGTAGSTGLVAQTVLPALLRADRPSTLVLEGGTHNPQAPPFEVLDRAFLPLLRRMGGAVAAVLERPGFYPAGGGRIVMTVRPSALSPLELATRGPLRRATAEAVVADLDPGVAERELAVLSARLGWPRSCLQTVEAPAGTGPGNVLIATLAFEELTEVFAGFGRLGVSAESVGNAVADAVRRYAKREVAVGPFLADQLLLPLALAGGGRFTATALTDHARTNAAVIERFLPVRIALREAAGLCTVAVEPR